MTLLFLRRWALAFVWQSRLPWLQAFQAFQAFRTFRTLGACRACGRFGALARCSLLGAAGLLGGAATACGPARPLPRRPAASLAAALPRRAAPRAVRVFQLRPGPGVERWLAAGAADAYEVDLAAGQYLAATIDQRGVDVAVDVYGPGRRPLFQVDGFTGAWGKEPVYLVAEVTGTYRLEVVAPAGAAGGAYAAHLDALRGGGAAGAASTADWARAEAERSLYEARGWDHHGPGSWEAAAKYERAARLSLQLGDRGKEAEALFRLGLLHLEEHRSREALAPLRRARMLFRALRAGAWVAVAEAEIGECQADLGDHELAFAAYGRALGYLQRQREGADLANLLGKLGALHAVRGEVAEGLRFFRRSIGIWQRLGDRAAEARALTYEAWLYRLAGKQEPAVADLWRAFWLDRQSRSAHAPVQLAEIGDVYAEMGDAARARPYFERALQMEGAAGNPGATGGMLMGLSVVLGRLGELGQALAAQRDAVRAFHAAGDRLSEINAWIGQGSVYLRMGQAQRAGESFGAALAQAKEAGYRNAQAQALLGIGRADRDRGALNAALAEGREAIRIVGELGAGAERPDLQASFAVANVSYFDFVVDTLMQLHAMRPGRGDDLLALEYSEQARAHGLLAALDARRERSGAGGAAGDAGNAPPALRAERERLRRQIAAADEERYELAAAGSPTGAVDRHLAELLERAHQLDDVPHRIAAAAAAVNVGDRPAPAAVADRTPGPRGAPAMAEALALPEAPAAPPRRRGEILGGALDDQTVLLEYYIGAERSYLWVADATSAASFELHGGARLAALVRSAYELLAGDVAAPDPGPESRQAPARSTGEGRLGGLAQLSEILLGQVAGRLGDKRLLIVANGPLQYLPFGALPEPGHGAEPLIVRHEIVYAPSLAVLAALRARRAPRAMALPPAGLVALFADPVFSRRGEGAAAAAAPPFGPQTGELPALPSSREEAAAIIALAGRKNVLASLGFDANRERVADPRLRRYPILHLATHGVLRLDQPDLSALALSQVDRAGNARDGYLRARDIADLDLPADLVVLSACKTALGKEMGNEGLIGLPQAFLTAGARQVLVSLWDVGDHTAAELMQRFYRSLLKDHLPPAAALRAAQIAMWRDPRWSSPTSWAAFVLQGDWR